MPTVSLYIPCYNGAQYLPETLEAVFNQDTRPNEILVVDDGSTDNSAEIADEFSVEVIIHPENRGLAAARNTGIRSAEGDLVAALDVDCVPDPSWLDQMVYFLEANNLHSCGGRLIETCRTSADVWRQSHMSQDAGPRPLLSPGDAVLIGGSNTLSRRRAIIAVGLYNEKFRTNGEDADMFARLLSQGLRIGYTPEAIARHNRRDTVTSVLRNHWNWYHSIDQNWLGTPHYSRVLIHILTAFGYLVDDLRENHLNSLPIDLVAPAVFYLEDQRRTRLVTPRNGSTESLPTNSGR